MKTEGKRQKKLTRSGGVQSHPVSAFCLQPSALSLGSNLGDRLENLTLARGKVAALPQTREVAFSSVYETEPVDAPEGSPNFFNAVMLIETSLSPLELLRATQAIENEFGRVRSVPNAPRTLDIDILFYGDVLMNTPELTLPHPRAHLRRFVMEPLAEVCKSLNLQIPKFPNP